MSKPILGGQTARGSKLPLAMAAVDLAVKLKFSGVTAGTGMAATTIYSVADLEKFLRKAIPTGLRIVLRDQAQVKGGLQQFRVPRSEWSRCIDARGQNRDLAAKLCAEYGIPRSRIYFALVNEPGIGGNGGPHFGEYSSFAGPKLKQALDAYDLDDSITARELFNQAYPSYLWPLATENLRSIIGYSEPEYWEFQLAMRKAVSYTKFGLIPATWEASDDSWQVECDSALTPHGREFLRSGSKMAYNSYAGKHPSLSVMCDRWSERALRTRAALWTWATDNNLGEKTFSVMEYGIARSYVPSGLDWVSWAACLIQDAKALSFLEMAGSFVSFGHSAFQIAKLDTSGATVPYNGSTYPGANGVVSG